MMTRILARRVIDTRGTIHTLTVVDIHNNGKVVLTPFRRETAATSYHSGTLRLIPAAPYYILEP